MQPRSPGVPIGVAERELKNVAMPPFRGYGVRTTDQSCLHEDYQVRRNPHIFVRLVLRNRPSCAKMVSGPVIALWQKLTP